MNRTLLVLATAWALTGCTSLDEAVTPTVTRASLIADPSKADALADIQIDLQVKAGSRAERSVHLGTVFFQQRVNADMEHDLVMALPAGFDPSFESNEVRSVTLVNIGTKNSELVPYCGMPAWLSVELTYDDKPTSGSLNVPFDLAVTCAH